MKEYEAIVLPSPRDADEKKSKEATVQLRHRQSKDLWERTVPVVRNVLEEP